MMDQLARTIVDGTLSSLGRRHSVDRKALMGPKLREEYSRVICSASRAFINRLTADQTLSEEQKKALRLYLQSETVTDEVSKLLDPGFEIFDHGRLAGALLELNLPLDEDCVVEAWDEFINAFSFASRSSPSLREFLRASYEAGSFRALSNISDALDHLNEDVDRLRSQESKLKGMIKGYLEDLSGYGEWARQFG